MTKKEKSFYKGYDEGYSAGFSDGVHAAREQIDEAFERLNDMVKEQEKETLGAGHD